MKPNFSGMDDKELLKVYQASKTQQPEPQGVGGILKKLAPGLAQGVVNAASVMGGGKPVYNNNNVNNLNQQYKLAQIESLRNKQTNLVPQYDENGNIAGYIQAPTGHIVQTPPPVPKETPEGFVNVGGKIVKDPAYITPEEQHKMDNENSRKDAQVQALKDSAQQSIGAIQEAKKGAKFFGPLGDLPSKYAPSSFMGSGNYNERSVWEANVNNILSKKVVDLIGEMKSLSKNGATGFGALSEREGQLLQEASTVLNKNLPPEKALYYLDEMEKIYQKIAGIQSQEDQSIQPQTIQQSQPPQNMQPAQAGNKTKSGNTFRKVG